MSLDLATLAPATLSTDTVKATTSYTGYYPHVALDSSRPLTGTWEANSWIAANGATSSQRFHVDLGEPKVVTAVRYENLVHVGEYTNCGVQNFTFWGSDSASDFADLAYANDGTWTQLSMDQSIFDIHKSANVADPAYVPVSTASPFRYYAFKFATNYGGAYIGVRRITLMGYADIPSGSAAALPPLAMRGRPRMR